MKIYQIPLLKCKEQQGITAIVVAIVIAMLIGFAALAVDVGYMATTKNELQNVADSAALAATGYLGNLYVPMTSSQANVYDCSTASSPNDCASIKAQAQDVVGSGKNRAGAQDITIDTSDVIIGQWDSDSNTFAATSSKPDAVRVIARRDRTAGGNGPITTFFARIFGVDTVDVTAFATAALSGLSVVPTGGLPLPIGIGKARFDSEYCDKPIKFYPTNDLEACGGWHVFEDSKTKIKQDILDGELADPPTFTSPEGETGDTYYFKGGTDNAAYEKLKEIFDMNKGINDYLDENGDVKDFPVDGDLDGETWSTTVVVYDWEDCSNPNTFIDIVGFSKIRIYEICTATSDPTVPIEGGQPDGPPPPQDYCVSGEKQIVAIITCDFTEPSRGGGGEYGIMGSIPGLVEPGPKN